ncbi:MAG TPA: molybdopterin-dependent oxidoreductase [Nitrososphaerales archaeon]|nr:molybdopterin-dependent oxidoreductase [Nitrososphaerales archaeon]HUK75054.1 molybdopterin-dependent oxidoreductase [Nitrososphaerales archaeon]
MGNTSEVLDQGEQTFVNMDLGGAIRVHVKDGKIVRVRPLIFGEEDQKSKSWTIQVGDKKFTPPRRVNLSAYTQGCRQRVYAENRILYPMKRVDFDPKSADRKTGQRGTSGYVRISWDEALTIVADEIRRVRAKYGPPAIAATTSSHHQWGNFNYRFSSHLRFFDMLGHTPVWHNPDSWEGWMWGAAHVYGFAWRLGAPDQFDLLEDALKNTEMVVHWGNDPEATHGIYSGQESTHWRYWLKELGKKQVFIDPYANTTSVLFADKWLAPRPGTDSALALAIAFTWLKEGTYDKEYVKTHTFGFDKWVDYVTGKEDKIPKTPEWAAELSGIPARTIRAFAREWGAKRTMLAVGSVGGVGSGTCRTAYAHEWARMMVILVGMQGYGKPGVNIWSTTYGAPSWEEFKFHGYAYGGMTEPGVAKKVPVNPVKQRAMRLLLPEALMGQQTQWRGEGFSGQSLEQQFRPYTNPLPAPDGSVIKMFYHHGASNVGTMPEASRWVKGFRSPNLEFFVCQAPWMEGEAKFADIILPVCSHFERADIGEMNNADGYIAQSFTANNHRVIMYMQKCIEPLGESKSDYEIYAALAEKLGMAAEYTEGNSYDDWLRKIYQVSDMPKVMGWEDFKKKGYYIVPFPDRHVSHRAFSSFYAAGSGLATPSGKLEFYSQSLAKFDPKDRERPPVPHYIQSWEGHLSEGAKKYPLQMITPHPKYSFHTHYDANTAWMGEIPDHRILKEGYYWWPLRIHPSDAKARGISDGDVVKVFNDRGTVLCIAKVTGRLRPGVVHAYSSAVKFDPLDPADSDSVDKGGCVNRITPNRMMSKNATGFGPNSCLVEVARWEGTGK